LATEGLFKSQPASILVVEDDPLEALSLQQVLIHLGYSVTAPVASGEAALVRAEKAPPDLVLLDIRLAGAMDGIEVGERLHARSAVPLVYLTASQDDALLERMKATEPYGYVSKPYQIPELQATIELALYKHATSERLRETNRRLEQEIAARREKEALAQRLNDQLAAQNENLRLSEARFHRMADSIQDGLVITENSRLTYLNDRACQILGRERPEAMQMASADILAFLQKPASGQAPAWSAELKSDEAEVWVRRPDGTRLCVHYRSTAAELANGGIQLSFALTDVTTRIQMEERLREISYHDALTGLYNRAFFEEEVSRLERGKRVEVSVIIADVDGLKAVNDRRGHRAGDELLRRAAVVLRQSVRTGDVVARIGGDEYGVLLPNTMTAHVEAKLADIRTAILLYNDTHDDLPVSLSLGAATADFHDVSLAEAIKLADDRMYQDKASRRKRRDA
jgi:diguanylate cyclase (GGDEF)-like protein/PAS domain S-box-containing protein